MVCIDYSGIGVCTSRAHKRVSLVYICMETCISVCTVTVYGSELPHVLCIHVYTH